MEGLDFETHELVEPAKCQILGIFGLIIQGVLGIMSFLALLVKRYFENPKRTWTVWGLDTSKQVFSALLAHCMNMALAILLSQEGGEAHDGNSEFGSSKSDNCDWYFINIAVDVFLGVFLCYLILISIEKVASYYEIYSLNTGIYIQEAKITVEAEHYDPEKQTEIEEIDYKIWVLQMAVWGIIVVILYFASLLETVTTILIGWLNIYPNIKLMLIMIVIPFILNSIQFWIQDRILKADKEKNIIFHRPGRYLRSLTQRPIRSNKIMQPLEMPKKRSESIGSTKEHVIKIDLMSDQ